MKIICSILIFVASIYGIYHSIKSYPADSVILYKYIKLVSGTTRHILTLKEKSKQEEYDLIVHPMVYESSKIGETFFHNKVKYNSILLVISSCLAIIFFFISFILIPEPIERHILVQQARDNKC